MARIDDLISELKEQGRDDDVTELEQLSGSSLRKKAGKADDLERENTDLKAQVEDLTQAPKREQALRDYGIALDDLRPAEKEVISALKGELTAEKIGELVEKYGLPVVLTDEDEDTDQSQAAKIAQKVRSAPSGAKQGVLSPEDTEGWSAEKLSRLREKYPEEWESLKRGETVTGIAV